MTPALPAIGSAIGLPILDGPRPPDYPAAISELAAQLATAAVAEVVLVACATFLLLWVLLYVTRLGRRLGEGLMVGGLLVRVVGGYVVPLAGAASG